MCKAGGCLGCVALHAVRKTLYEQATHWQYHAEHLQRYEHPCGLQSTSIFPSAPFFLPFLPQRATLRARTHMHSDIYGGDPGRAITPHVVALHKRQVVVAGRLVLRCDTPPEGATCASRACK